jgi:hypothetical protein
VLHAKEALKAAAKEAAKGQHGADARAIAEALAARHGDVEASGIR